MIKVGSFWSRAIPLGAGQCAGGAPAFPEVLAYAIIRNEAAAAIASHRTPATAVRVLCSFKRRNNVLKSVKKYAAQTN